MGYQVVAGVDEVGMGPLAGPVVGGAVVLPIGVRIAGLDDSKLLNADQRERLDRSIRRRALAVSVCAVDHAQVDSLGLLRARHLATAGAVAGLRVPAEYLLVDAWDVPDAQVAQMAVVRGDRICASIMAASIVAKVARDRAMVCLVGQDLKFTPGVAGRIFGSLETINILMISQGASEINLTFVIEEDEVPDVIQRLHKTFFSDLDPEVFA